MDKYAYCEDIIKEASTTFHKAFSELETDKANAVFSIYDFCRTADDAIDEDNDIEKINTLKTQIQAIFNGEDQDDLMLSALKETIETFPSAIKPYLELLSGMEDDYNFKPVKTEEDLDNYTYKVAGTVGLMLIPLLASETYKKQKETLEAIAVKLGQAMQITNILRDVRKDLMRQRLYFPETVIKQYQVNIETLRTGIVTPEYKSMIESYIEKAKSLYQAFYDHIDLFDKEAIYPTLLAAKYYENILDEIRKNGYDNLTKRHYVGKLKKYLITKKAKKELSRKGLI